MRKEELKGYCFNKLQAIEHLLNNTNFSFAPMLKIKLMAKKNIVKHLVDYETCFNFASVEDLEKYINDRADIICGFYEE